MSEYEEHKRHLFNVVTGLQAFYEREELTQNDITTITMLKNRISNKIDILFKLIDEKSR